MYNYPHEIQIANDSCRCLQDSTPQKQKVCCRVICSCRLCANSTESAGWLRKKLCGIHRLLSVDLTLCRVHRLRMDSSRVKTLLVDYYVFLDYAESTSWQKTIKSPHRFCADKVCGRLHRISAKNPRNPLQSMQSLCILCQTQHDTAESV